MTKVSSVCKSQARGYVKQLLKHVTFSCAKKTRPAGLFPCQILSTQ